MFVIITIMINATESEISIQLSPSELRWCQNHAEEIVEYYGGHGTKGSGTYNHNKISSNLVGVKSELATCRWLKEQDLKIRIERKLQTIQGKRFEGDIQARGKVMEERLAPSSMGQIQTNDTSTPTPLLC